MQKDRITPREISIGAVSATQPNAHGGSAASQSSQQTRAGSAVSQGTTTTPKVIICRYCKVAINEGDKNHYMNTCSALNLISEPVTRGEDGSIEMTPYAARMASMTLLRPSSETPQRPRGRPKR